MIGKKVRTNYLIQSDDRLNGIDDGTEVIPSGTIGVIYAKSSDFLSEDESEDESEDKDPMDSFLEEKMFLVEFELPNGRKQTFDLLPEEFTVVEE